MARPERFELPTSWFVARRSIQLSYGRNGQTDGHAFADCIGAVRVRLECSARPRQGREYYHINYGSLGQFLGIPQICSRRLLVVL